GKILACFAVFGKEAHVGQVFAGFDPNLLTAEITSQMCYSPALCDQRLGETTLPPVSLKQTDTKESYTVQTALSSYSYYNVFTYGMDAATILRKCKETAINAMDAVIRRMNQSHSIWCAMAGQEETPLPWNTRVYLWHEYVEELAAANGEGFKAHIDRFAQRLAAESPELDLRVYSFAIVQEARKYDLQDTPCVVIFAGSTFYPRVEVSGQNEKERALTAAAETAAAEMTFEAQKDPSGKLHPMGVKMFYPYISDSSFLYDCSEADDSAVLAADMPAYGFRYIHPEELIRRIDAPVVNIGTFGADGHMFTERVEKHHSFQAVPQMVFTTVCQLLK
ncbi:MAG: peptidase M20, partial [Firmicutes bacterium]|nr:peptidase M20 [Bacillota bacterium]